MPTRTTSRPPREEILRVFLTMVRRGKAPSISAFVKKLGTNRAYLYELFPQGKGELCQEVGIAPDSLTNERMKRIATARGSHARQPRSIGVTLHRGAPEPPRSGVEPEKDYELVLRRAQLAADVESVKKSYFWATENKTDPPIVAIREELGILCDELKAKVKSCSSETELETARKEFELLRGWIESQEGLPRMVCTALEHENYVLVNGPKVEELKRLMESLGIPPDEQMGNLRQILSEYGNVRRLHDELPSLQAQKKQLEDQVNSFLLRIEILNEIHRRRLEHVSKSMVNVESDAKELQDMVNNIRWKLMQLRAIWNSPTQQDNAKEILQKIMDDIPRYVMLADDILGKMGGAALRVAATELYMEEQDRRLDTNQPSHAAQGSGSGLDRVREDPFDVAYPKARATSRTDLQPWSQRPDMVKQRRGLSILERLYLDEGSNTS